MLDLDTKKAAIKATFYDWLKYQLLRLSVDTLAINVCHTWVH